MDSLLDLPNEILVEILKYSSSKALISLSETCKRFNDLVFQNSSLVNRIPLLLSSDIKNSVSIQKSKRSYSNIKISYDFLPDIHLPILKKFGENVTNLDIQNCEIGLDDFKTIFDSCPNLEVLAISNVNSFADNDGNFSQQLPKLEKLKKLSFTESYLEIFKLLMDAQLTDLTLRFCEDNFTDFMEFIKFFQSQVKLESFALEQIKDTNLFALDFSKNFKSQLKKFKMENCGFDIFDIVTENVSKFLAGQTNLEEISIAEVDFLTHADYDHLLTKNPKLKTVTLDVRRYTSRNRQCTSVKNLNLMYVNNDPYFEGEEDEEEEESETPARIRNLAVEFPNVEVLNFRELIDLDYQALKCIADTMGNLKELTIFDFPNQFSYDNINFPSLKSLHLFRTWHLTEENFKLLLENNKQIIYLKLHNGIRYNNSTVQIIVDNLKDLETLKIYGDNKFTKEVFSMIAENLKKLKIFRMKHWCQKFKKSDMAALDSIPGLKVFAKDY